MIIISAAVLLAIYRYASQKLRRVPTPDCQYSFKHTITSAVQIALEILIAADIINTVILDTTIENVVVLGILVFIRTFLSWTLVLDTEGHWPWAKPTARH